MDKTEIIPGRGTRFDRDWTQGSIARNLLRLSWPMIVAMSVNMLGPTIDMIWVGKLGSTSVAAVGVAGLAMQFVMALMMGLTTGVRAVIARFVGAHDMSGANHAAQQAFVISAAFAGVVALIGVIFPELFLALMGVEADVAAQGAEYIRIVFFGLVFMSFGIVSGGIMQASGDSLTPMKISIVSRLFHVALCPFLIFGWWIFPQMGVSGAALTNAISGGLGVSVGLWILFSGRTRLHPTLKGFRIDLPMLWRMVRVGFPASITQMQWTLTELVVMWLVVPFGTIALAAHTINQRVMMILIMPGAGLGQAAGILAGQNLGAGQPARAERTGWIGTGIMTVIAVVCSVVILIWAEEIARIFGTETELIGIASDFLRISAVGFVMIGLNIVLQQTLAGAGDTTVLMVLGLVTVCGIQIPLAYFLSQITDFGVYGIRWALVIGGVLGGIILPVYFRLGRWKRKKV